jgi:hypothetical protein
VIPQMQQEGGDGSRVRTISALLLGKQGPRAREVQDLGVADTLCGPS